MSDSNPTLKALRAAIANVEAGPVRSTHEANLASGWAAIDDALGGGLVLRGVHEWFSAHSFTPCRTARWTAPLGPIVDLVHRAVARGGGAIWIGHRCHPNPRVLVSGLRGTALPQHRLLTRSLFAHAPHSLDARVWMIEQAIACDDVRAVVADGSGLEMNAIRRLSMATEKRRSGVLVCLVRPPWETRMLSTASTRWLVAPVRDGTSVRWRVRLVRAKPPQERTFDGGFVEATVGIQWETGFDDDVDEANTTISCDSIAGVGDRSCPVSMRVGRSADPALAHSCGSEHRGGFVFSRCAIGRAVRHEPLPGAGVA